MPRTGDLITGQSPLIVLELGFTSAHYIDCIPFKISTMKEKLRVTRLRTDSNCNRELCKANEKMFDILNFVKESELIFLFISFHFFIRDQSLKRSIYFIEEKF